MALNKLSVIASFLLIAVSGCYTVLKHPEVEYTDKLGFNDSSMLNQRVIFTRVNFSDNCLSCHQDYSYLYYFQPKTNSDSTDNQFFDKVHQFNYIPWWSNEVWYENPSSDEDLEDVSRRSRRAYRKVTSESSGEINYMAAPGVIPLNDKSIKEGSSQAKDTQKAALPERQKDSPTGNQNESNDNDQKQKKSKPKRRR